MAQVKELQLRVIYDPERERKGVAEIDLVLVHGFGGDFIDTWTYKDVERSVFWPKDLLLSEQKQPRTRILSFGYDAGELVVASIRVYARTMLGFLKDQREGIESRPIVFLGHCLGGLIVKQAMSFAQNERAYNSIISATKSIMFFGTPHGGGDKKDWRKLADCYKGLGRRCKMIDVLGKSTDDLTELDEDFTRLQNRFTIVNFLEQQNMPGAKKPIVDQTSAAKFPGAEVVHANGTHVTMCQFRNAENGAFIKVCGVIRQAIVSSAAVPQVANNQVATTLVATHQTPTAVNQQVLVNGQVIVNGQVVVNGQAGIWMNNYQEATAAEAIETPELQASRGRRAARPTANQRLLEPTHAKQLPWGDAQDMSLETADTGRWKIGWW